MAEKEWVMPTHIIAVSGVVTNKSGEILMVKTHNSGWVLPGGQVEAGENLPDAVKREIWEESGIEVSVGEVFCIASNTCKHPGYNGVKEVPTKLLLDFVCEATGGETRPSEENSETQWVKKEEVLLHITSASIIERFQAYLEYDQRPVYMEYVTYPAFELKLKTNL